MSITNFSSEKFIIRGDEIELFRKILNNPGSKTWIINIYSNGLGGLGKTWLLEYYGQVLLQDYPHIRYNQDFIDFYFTPNQLEFGVLDAIVEQFGVEHFEAYSQALDRYEERLRQPFVPMRAEEYKILQKEVYNCFLENYHALASLQPIVLMLDTAEEAGDAGDYFWKEILPSLKGNTLVVIAGRKPLPLGDEEEGHVRYLLLDPLAEEKVARYFQLQGVDSESWSREAITTIWERTKKGHPILLALVAEHLSSSSLDELFSIPADEFIHELISRVYNIRDIENQVILFMGYIWRRFNSKILNHLLPEKSVDKCLEILQALARLPFIKYRKAQLGQLESCLLHDEMRDLVRSQVWPLIDRDANLAKELSEKMITYYDQKIPGASDERKRQSLISEQLYYKLTYDLETGFAGTCDLFNEKSRLYDISFCEAINTEVERHDKRLSVLQREEHKFNQGWVAAKRGMREKASSMWEELANSSGLSDTLKAKVLTYLVEFHADGGEFPVAENYGKHAEELYAAIIKSATSPEAKNSVVRESGLLFNNLGYMYRRQENWEKAIYYYERALKTGGDDWQKARIHNNLGFALHLLGRSELAFSHCETALRIRKKLGNPYELGLSYNTLGILYVDALRIPEAESSFQEAIQYFHQAHSIRGRALVHTALGRLYRQWGWYENHVVGKPFDPNNDKYKNALGYLRDAIDIFTDEDDEAGLAEAYQELGCLQRERKEWNRAVDTLKKALENAQSRNIQRREADILQDFSITYQRQGNLLDANDYAEKAAKKAEAAGFPYLLSKAQWTMGDIAYARGQFNMAFEEYAEACINITKLDPAEVGHESAKKKLAYEDLIRHVEDQIEHLPTPATIQTAISTLTEKWKKAGMTDTFRGFVTRISALATTDTLQ